MPTQVPILFNPAPMSSVIPPGQFRALEDVPDDIWRRIFHHVLLLPPASPFSKHENRGALLQICRKWTRIVLGTSELWQDVAFSATRGTSSSSSSSSRNPTSSTRGYATLEAFQQAMGYSSQRTLDLAICITPTSRPSLADILNGASTERHRLSSLDVSLDADVPRGRSHRGDSFDARSFVTWPQSPNMVFPALVHFRMEYVNFTSSDDLRLLLTHCPKIESLEMKHVVVDDPPDGMIVPWRLQQPLILPMLRQASLEMLVFKTLLRLRVETPDLAKIKIWNHLHVEWDPPHLDVGGLPSLLASVRSLLISSSPTTGPDANIVTFLSEARRLERLCLVGCGGPQLLHALGHDAEHASAEILCPRLDALKLVHAQVDDVSVLSFLDRRLPGDDGFPDWVTIDLEHCRNTTAAMSMELISRARGFWMP